MKEYYDKNGRQIEVLDTLYNPYDANGSYIVLASEDPDDDEMYLGDFSSPLRYYNPENFWEVVDRNGI